VQNPWPHAPPHHFTPHGVYMITAGTLHNAPLFGTAAKLDLFRDTTFELIDDYSISLRAWAFFKNHYHLVVGFEDAQTQHQVFVRHLHRQLAIRLNAIDATPSEKLCISFGTLS
jgi:hypothetical protein